VLPAHIRETTKGDPMDIASANARSKARKVARAPRGRGRFVLAADTVVAIDERAYGKPANEAQARAWLRELSGRDHQVHGAITIIRPEFPPDVVLDAQTTTDVRFRALDDAMIEWYLATGEWRGRAGGYAIQGAGAALVSGIRGDYYNVVGLSVTALTSIAPELLGCNPPGAAV
jgi:septum formation protein